jgi:hypothetical protein
MGEIGEQRRICAKTTLQHGQNWRAAMTFPTKKNTKIEAFLPHEKPSRHHIMDNFQPQIWDFTMVAGGRSLVPSINSGAI